jgi:dihydrofolate synthase/folylpolyglutamate synthase
MVGDFQAMNAALATAAVEALPQFDVPEAALRRGLLNAKIPGRVEVVQHEPTVILDGAHNPEKIAAARRAIDQFYGEKRRITVLGLKSDKAAADVLPAVVNGTDLLIVTQFQLEKALWQPMDVDLLAQLAAETSPGLQIRVVPDPLVAVETALTAANSDDLVWVTGSFYLVGNVRECWYPSPALVAQAEIGLSGALTL